MYIPRFYRAACDTQPYAAQGWLELSKMEEECGQQMRAALVVRRGLEFCSLSDTLLTRTLKCAEGLEAVTVLRINKVLATLQTTSFRRLAPVLYWHPSSIFLLHTPLKPSAAPQHILHVTFGHVMRYYLLVLQTVQI